MLKIEIKKHSHQKSYKYQEMICGEVSIENGCWIGDNVIILAGAKIGEKTIVGAGSVIATSIPSYSIAVGNPAKVIKHWDFNNSKWIK